MQSPSPPPAGYVPAAGGARAARYGGFWIRAVAYIIDTVILSLGNVIIEAIFQARGTAALGGAILNPQGSQSPVYGAVVAVEIVITIAYFVGLWSYTGATLGQRLFRLRVVDADTGQPISLGKALLRWVGIFISSIACFVGLIWVAFDSRKQGWADKIAGTLVLRG
jgi:uncharacterized RDD family membrane protein YckC